MTAVNQQVTQRGWATRAALRGLAAGYMATMLISPAAAESLADVTGCMRANVPDTVRAQRVQFLSVDRGGSQRTLTGRVVASREGGLMRANLRLSAPPDLKGAAYLSRETEAGGDEMYVYLPALNRVRRVVGGGRDHSLFGTDFSYNDLRQLHDAFSGDEVTLLGEIEFEARPVYHLEVIRSDAHEGVNRLQAWVDRAACVALQIDLLAGDVVVKRMTSPGDGLRQLPSGQWYAEQVRVEDRDAGSSTDMTVIGVELGTEVPTRLFNPRSFYLGP